MLCVLNRSKIIIWKIRQYYQLQTYMKDMDRKVIIKALKGKQLMGDLCVL